MQRMADENQQDSILLYFQHKVHVVELMVNKEDFWITLSLTLHVNT